MSETIEEAAERLAQEHVETDVLGQCSRCGEAWPCATVRIVYDRETVKDERDHNADAEREALAADLEKRLRSAHEYATKVVQQREARGQEVRALRAALEAAKIPHLRVDGDPWFSCQVAKQEDSDDPSDYPDARCDCGATAHNARIVAALRAATQEPTAGSVPPDHERDGEPSVE